MPTDSILFSIGVCTMFLLFAIVLAWVDHTTSQWLNKAAAEQNSGMAEPPRREAA
jgi:hypothetical protein